MLNFYPGPSKLYPKVENYLADAFKSGILSQNHRSKSFMDLFHSATSLLKQKLNIPSDYSVFYISSATEAWQIISQSLVKEASTHFFNGNFGEKWFNYAKLIHPQSEGIMFDYTANFPFEKLSNTELVAITQNETSNGTALTNEEIKKIRNSLPQSLIAIDVTSSLGGINLEIQHADIWFASVQKCLGLPSGLGLLICSPKAIKKAFEVNNRVNYNSIIYNYEQMQNLQTTHTPNILGIYLLNSILADLHSIEEISTAVKERSAKLYVEIKKLNSIKLLVENTEIQSETVITLKIDENRVEELKSKLLAKDILIGNGYGYWKKSTLRIANFPQIEDWEYEKLLTALQEIDK